MPGLLDHLPSVYDVLHALTALEVAEDGPGDAAVDVRDGLTRDVEERPEKSDHGSAKDNDTKTGLKAMLGWRLHRRGRPRVTMHGASQEDEGGVSKGICVAHDRLHTGIFRRRLSWEEARWNLDDPLVQGQLEIG